MTIDPSNLSLREALLIALVTLFVIFFVSAKLSRRGKRPKVRKLYEASKWAFLSLLAVMVSGTLLFELLRSPTEDELEERRRKEAGCQLSLECWGRRHEVSGWTACQLAIEASARFRVEWTSGMFEPKFKPPTWSRVGPSGSLRFAGSQIRMENGFGAWQRMSYACDYDPSTDRVLALDVW